MTGTGYNIHEGSLILSERLRPDPPRRSDNRCAECGKPLPTPKPQRGVDLGAYLRDPFCSGVCCRAWHKIPEKPIYGGDPSEKRGRWQRAA